MPEGVVGWPVYEGFQIGEQESSLARNAFDTFIPIGAETSARKNIIFDFFDLLAAVAAHGKMNGMAGRKLSRMAGWWAFEHSDDGKGFEGGYKSWSAAADATSHLFFAYLRTLSPDADHGMSLIERIPRSLQALLASTEYPPETPTLMQTSTSRVVMLVDAVSPSPFALLRRAKHFEFRDRDRVLREYSEFEDPVDALSDECKRVLYAISSTNSSAARSRHQTSMKTDESWSAFQNMGFADIEDKSLQKAPNGINGSLGKPTSSGLRSEPRSRNADFARPTTPSWADFLSSGFAEDDVNKTSVSLLLPPDQVLPPFSSSRAQTPSHIPEDSEHVAPGELAAITDVNLDDAFWWVWMTSLAGEESAERKAVFGRCAIIETTIMNGRWLIMEEQVKGASPDPVEGAYIAKKKSLFSFTKRGRLGRKKSKGKESFPPTLEYPERVASATPSKTSLAPDQQSKIKQAAAALRRQDAKDDESSVRRGRYDDPYSTKTNSTLTMGLQSEAVPAMKWMGAYDKNAIRAQYLGDAFAGRGASREDLGRYASSTNINGDGASTVHAPAPLSPDVGTISASHSTRDLTALPNGESSSMQPEPAIMPPTSPSANALPDDAAASQQEAAQVPVPEVTAPAAIEKELAVDPPASPRRKPVPASHPAFRQKSSDEADAPGTPTSPTQNAAAIAAARAMQQHETSPKSNKSGQTRLKKRDAGSSSGGLKKLFGRKKDNRQSMDVVKTGGSSSLAPPAEQPSRKLSLRRKKPAPVVIPNAAATETSHQNASELEAEPVMPESHGRFEQSSAAVSNVDSQEQTHADQEFARFDQGPVDEPAHTPQGSEPEIAAPVPQRKVNSRLAGVSEPESGVEDFETPMERPEPEIDAQSETTMEDRPEFVQPEKDRWATIRENAARRAERAARHSEDQSLQSRPSQSQRTDDGETSGEESKSSAHIYSTTLLTQHSHRVPRRPHQSSRRRAHRRHGQHGSTTINATLHHLIQPHRQRHHNHNNKSRHPYPPNAPPIWNAHTVHSLDPTNDPFHCVRALHR